MRVIPCGAGFQPATSRFVGTFICLPVLLLAQTGAADFARQAYAALPVEDSYAFHKVISEWREPLRRDPAAKPLASEIAIPAQGWRILVQSDSGEVLKTAAAEFSEYLDRSMKVRAVVEQAPSFVGWQALKNTI